MAPRRAEPVNSHVFCYPAAREPVNFQVPALQGAKMRVNLQVFALPMHVGTGGLVTAVCFKKRKKH